MFRTSVNVMTGEVTVMNLTPEEIAALGLTEAQIDAAWMEVATI